MRRRRWLANRLILLVGCLGAGLIWFAPAAAAQDATSARAVALSATASSDELPLARSESADIVVVLRNASSDDANGVEVMPAAASPVLKIVPAVPVIAAVPAGSSESLRFTVTRSEQGVAESFPVQLLFAYTQVARPTTTAVLLPSLHQVAVASFKVKAIDAPALAQMSFQGGTEAVSEERPVDIALVVTNKRDGPISMSTLEVSSPHSLRTSIPAGILPKDATIGADTSQDILLGQVPVQLEGKATLIVPLAVTAESQVVPGDRSLRVRLVVSDGLAVDRLAPGRGLTAELVGAQPLKVEIFGESALLGALGVPMLLLLPGLIVLTTLGVLLQTARPWRHAAGGSELDITSKATFGAVLGVFISLLVTVAYPTLTGWIPGDSRNLRKAYGFNDFYYVYAWSFGIAFALFGLAWLAWPAASWCFLPRVEDKAPDLLRKLALRGAVNRADLVIVADAAATNNLAVHVADTRVGRFVMPPVKILLKPGATATRLEAALAKKRLVWGWWSLRKANADEVVEDVAFEGSPFIVAPSEVDATKAPHNGIPHDILTIP